MAVNGRARTAALSGGAIQAERQVRCPHHDGASADELTTRVSNPLIAHMQTGTTSGSGAVRWVYILSPCARPTGSGSLRR